MFIKNKKIKSLFKNFNKYRNLIGIKSLFFIKNLQ